MDKIVFNDYDVTVEIYDAVIAKWANTDYGETDPQSSTYLRNRDKIQPKLVEGTNVTIDPETNTISAEFRLDQVEQLVSTDAGNEVKLGKDGLLLVSFNGLLRNYGSVSTREDLPDTAKVFDAYYIEDEKLYVFAHMDSALGLVWLPLSFFVDMKLYVSKVELTETLKSYPTNDDMSHAIDVHNSDEESHPFLVDNINSIREEMSSKEHFRGYYATNAEVLALPNPESGDYAYSAESGTKWIYDTAWTDSGVVVPDQMVPPSDALPLMNGATASAGVSNQYSRGDHVHQSDATKLNKVTSTASNARAYCVDTTGQQVMTPLSVGADANTIPVRDSAGGIAVGTPTTNSGATPKSYVDDGLGKKVDKFKAAAGTVVAYVANGEEQGVVQVSDDTAEAGTIACRNANGALVVAEPEEDNEAVPKSYLTKSIEDATGAKVLGNDFAEVQSGLVSVVAAKAIGNTQLLVQFTPTNDITQENSPVTIFSNLDNSLLPSLGVRFGQVWDNAKVEQVGFCLIDADGDITINALATMFAGTQYILLV